jgi:hypothetical protein
MVRIRHITDPELKRRVIAKLAEWRGMAPSQVPEWFELDDADFSDILIELREEDERSLERPHDPRE